MPFEFSDKDQKLRLFFYNEDGEFTSNNMMLIKAHTGLPVRSTLKPNPDVKEHEVAVFDRAKDDWVVYADYRGIVYNKVTKEPQSFSERGALPTELTHLKPMQFDVWDEDSGSWKKDADAELSYSKQEAILSVKSYAATIRKKIAGDADHYETAGWADKARRAERFIAGVASTEDEDIIRAEAERRGHGETVEQLVELQAQKSVAFAKAVAVIDGLVSSAITAIESDEIDSTDAVEALLNSLKTKATEELAGLLGD